MLFRMALRQAAMRHGDLTAEQRAALRQVTLRYRRRVDGDVVRLDQLAEEDVAEMLHADQPALLAGALIGGATLAEGVGGLVGKIDWGQLLDWLVANLPKIIEIIMSLIAMF